ncbi:MAG: DUF6320 domain-containing protein [Christensenellaceae bacterium]|jgi:hypothetical protein|nr:DUF6320 domain-containing protein [Christensenellaceae bacterium]
MTCPDCGIEIGCRAYKCPLCHKILVNDSNIDDMQMLRLPRYFPPLSKAPAFATALFDKIYLVISICIAITMLITFILLESFRFFWVTLAGLLYLYFLIRYTIRGTNHLTQKVVFQTLLLTAISFTLPTAFTSPLVIYEYILPAIYLTSIIILGIFTLIHFKMMSRHLINLVFVALLGIFPFVINIVTDSTARPNLIFSSVTGTLAVTIIILSLIFSSKQIISQLKRIFHV